MPVLPVEQKEESLSTTPEQRPAKMPGGITGKGFRPGRSGNPAGRAKGVVAYIKSKTKDGKVLTDRLLSIAQGEPQEVTQVIPSKMHMGAPTVISFKITPPIREQIMACQDLLNRAFGKPADLDPDGEPTGPGSRAFLMLRLSDRHDPLSNRERVLEIAVQKP